jgi:hypothetical protein
MKASMTRFRSIARLVMMTVLAVTFALPFAWLASTDHAEPSAEVATWTGYWTWDPVRRQWYWTWVWYW